MELQQMRYVLAIAETNSFTRAAERCLVVQSSLSHQVARLEKELGARLFERTSRMVRLTPAGEAFLPAARQCLDAAERAVAEVAATVGEVRGRLAVALSPTASAVDVTGALHGFRRRHPQVCITLRTSASDSLVERVKEGAVDVAFLGVQTTKKPTGVAACELSRDPLVAVVSPEHPLASEPAVSLGRLSAEVFVDLPPGTAGRSQSDAVFSAAGLGRQVAFEVATMDSIAGLVGRNLAVAMLPSGSAHRLTGVATVDLTDAPLHVEYAVWSGSRHTPAVAAFLAVLDITAQDPHGS